MAMNRDRNDQRNSEYNDKVVAIKRVSKTVKGGRTMRFSALVVVGDGKGKVGVGLGKAGEVPEAIRKGKEAAMRNIVDLCVHDPAPPGHNPHAHILLTMRPLDEHGHWMEKAKKEYKLLLEAYKEKSRGSVLSDLSERKADTPSVKPPGKDSKGIAADR